MSMKEKETSDRIAHLAAIVLHKMGISMVEKELAGSAHSQHHTMKHSSAKIGSLASHVLSAPNACVEAKELAGSVLTQVRQHGWRLPTQETASGRGAGVTARVQLGS